MRFQNTQLLAFFTSYSHNVQVLSLTIFKAVGRLKKEFVRVYNKIAK